MKKITLKALDEYISHCPHYVDGDAVTYLAQLDAAGELVPYGGKHKYSVETTLAALGLSADASPDDISYTEDLSNPGYTAALTELATHINIAHAADIHGDQAQISIDNSATACTVDEALAAHTIDEWADYMIDDIRECVHDELAPCTDAQFLMRYLELAPVDLIIG